MTPEQRAFIASHRVARMATADQTGTPHVVPVCYAFDGTSVYTALDRKPKRLPARRLRRVRNIQSNPRVSLIVDDYSEDWSMLRYVLVHGTAEVLETGNERDRAEELLREKYPQYAGMLDVGSSVIKIVPDRVTSWSATGTI